MSEEDIKILEELKNKKVNVSGNMYSVKWFELDEREKQAIEHLISDNLEYQKILDIFDERTYRKKYLEERRKEKPNLLYPDSDEIYERYYKLKQENEELKEYIMLAPNLDEMTAIKYINIQRNAYLQGKAEEQQKAEQLIYEKYIPVSLVEKKIEEYNQRIEKYYEYKEQGKETDVEFYENITNIEIVIILQELLEKRK